MTFEFVLYFSLAFFFFVTVSIIVIKILDKIEEKRARRFEQKVDRYRRGNR